MVAWRKHWSFSHHQHCAHEPCGRVVVMMRLPDEFDTSDPVTGIVGGTVLGDLSESLVRPPHWSHHKAGTQVPTFPVQLKPRIALKGTFTISTVLMSLVVVLFVIVFADEFDISETVPEFVENLPTFFMWGWRGAAEVLCTPRGLRSARNWRLSVCVFRVALGADTYHDFQPACSVHACCQYSVARGHTPHWKLTPWSAESSSIPSSWHNVRIGLKSPHPFCLSWTLHCEGWFRIIRSLYWTRIISFTGDGCKSDGREVEASRMRRTSSWCSVCSHPGQNGRCTIFIKDSKVWMSRYLDTSTKTNGLNCGPVWKIQSFLLSEICTVIL